jgi:hypothetical protein
MTATLRLGPIPKTETVKLTIALPSSLKADLQRYAELHTQTFGEKIDVPTLIPHMLQTFITRDRAFQKRTRTAVAAQDLRNGAQSASNGLKSLPLVPQQPWD